MPLPVYAESTARPGRLFWDQRPVSVRLRPPTWRRAQGRHLSDSESIKPSLTLVDEVSTSTILDLCLAFTLELYLPRRHRPGPTFFLFRRPGLRNPG